MENQKKSPLTELLINIVLPTLILNKGGEYLGENGSTKALILATLFPVIYAIYDYLKLKKAVKNGRYHRKFIQ